MKNGIRKLGGDCKGATAIEYGLIAALIVIASMAALEGLASQTVGMWNDVATKVTDAS